MAAPELSPDRLQDYRNRTFRLLPDLRLRSKEEAIAFVKQRGFITFWPIKGITLPSLWTAVAGDRPVADEHDDPGHVTWGWKDDLLGARRWYYAKVLRGKATLIAVDVVPCFYALSENYGDPEHDYLQQYADGLLSHPAKVIYEAVLRQGPLDTLSLRHTVGMTGKASKSAFERALVELQRDFKILPVGVARAGGWRYSFVYEVVHRHFPDLPERARRVSRKEAQETLMHLYLESVGAITLAGARKVFQWSPQDVRAALEALAEAGHLRAGCRLSGSDQEHYVLSALLDVPRGLG